MTAVRDKIRTSRSRLRLYLKVNWIKTLWFNFAKFPFATAVRLPVFFYGSVRFSGISGDVAIDAPIRRGMIGFGQPYELMTRSRGIAEINIRGSIRFKGNVQFGKDYFLYIHENAAVEMGHMSSLGNSGKIICYQKITFGNYARIGFESQLMDSNFHQMRDTKTGEQMVMTAAISIGNHNYLGNRISVMKGSITPDCCTVASGSLCTKDYTPLGTNILIGGVPAGLLRSNIARDWDTEQKELEKWLTV